VKSVVESTLQSLAAGDDAAAQRLLGDEPSDEGDNATADAPTGNQASVVARRMVATLACKAAVKAGEALAAEEALALLVEAERIESSYACPHGRPTTISFTFQQLDDLFGRS